MTSSSAQSTDSVLAKVSREIVPLGKVATIVSGFGFPKELQGNTEGALPFFKVGDISAAWNSGRQLLTTAQHYLSEEEAKSIKARAFPKGTIVFAKIGEAIKLNRRAILGQPALVDNNVMGLIPDYEVVDHRYLFYWALTQKLGDISQATTVPSIRKSDVEELKFPLVHVDQQKRIVAEIEKQFSRLDEAVANLKRVKANLKRYKAAVLKAAVEGRLVETEAELARREGRNYETGTKLLQRILETRRSQWKGKGKYKEPAAPDTTDLPELPEGWVWATADQLAEKITDGEHISPVLLPSGVPLLSAKDVRDFGVLFEDAKYVSPDDATRFRGRCDPDRGDILIVSRGATVGRACRVNVDQKICLMGSVILMKLHKLLESNYALFALKAGFFLTRLTAVSGSTAQQAIYIRDIRPLPLPLPPFVEQQRIVAEVDRRLSLVREVDEQVDANVKRAERLRQSILAKSFSCHDSMCIKVETLSYG